MKLRPRNRSWTMGSYADTRGGRRSVPGLADPGICTRCGARLSVYRNAEETTCAPCGSIVKLRTIRHD